MNDMLEGISNDVLFEKVENIIKLNEEVEILAKKIDESKDKVEIEAFRMLRESKIDELRSLIIPPRVLRPRELKPNPIKFPEEPQYPCDADGPTYYHTDTQPNTFNY